MYQRAGISSGGGGGSAVSGTTIKINGTETDKTTSVSQTFTIETGLSAIHNFTYMADSDTSTDFRQIAMYRDSRPTKYDSYYYITTGAVGKRDASIGTEAGAGDVTISNINGGTVTLISPSNANYGKMKNICWFAD